jgi:transcriptional regulator with AAA-type ATPase domain
MSSSPADERTKSNIFPAWDSPPRVLLLLEGGVSTFELRPGATLTVGRAKECNIRIDHPSVSRRHARLYVGPPLEVEDLGSSNGTRLSGRRLMRGEREVVRHGALIEIGLGTIVVQGNEPLPAQASAAPAEPRDGLAPIDDAYEPTMARVHRLVELVARGRLSVLLLGETGAGKEVMAERIHRSSPRSERPFVRIHCAALPETLLESELFGHERGAFTGATQTKVGLLETADGGTLLLDEVGELPLVTQAKLLRVLETREILRLGAVKSSIVDVRFIAATNRDLEELIEQGKFRRDLYYRLNGISIAIPPLRERIDEIPTLAQQFIAQACREMGWPMAKISADAMAVLASHAWPGNVRELRNAMERAVMLSGGRDIQVAHVAQTSPSKRPTSAASVPKASSTLPPSKADLRAELAALEKQRIVEALQASGGNQRRAAEILGISRRTLLARLDEHDIPRPRKKAP